MREREKVERMGRRGRREKKQREEEYRKEKEEREREGERWGRGGGIIKREREIGKYIRVLVQWDMFLYNIN